MRTGNPKGFELREQDRRTGQDTLKKSRKILRGQ